MRRNILIPAIIVLLACLGGCGIVQCAKATVPAEATTAGPYACDGNRTFTFTFGIDDDDDLLVYLVDEDGAQTLLTKTTHYSITSANANDPQDLTQGGTVTTVATYSSDYAILLVRDTELSSTLDIDDEDVEDAIDKLTRIVQELAEKAARAIHVQAADAGVTTEIEPAGNAGYLYRQSDGDFVVASPMEIGDANVSSFIQGLLDDANPAEARATLGAATSFWVDVTEAPYNAKGDGVYLTTGVTVAGDATFTCTAASWSSADVGKRIFIHRAGAAGGRLETTIASINTTTSIELTDAASTSVNPAYFLYGTDDNAAIQAAFDAATDGQTIFFPTGRFLTSATLHLDSAYTTELTVRGMAGPDWYGSKKSVIWCTDPNANIIESQLNVVQFLDLCFRNGISGRPDGDGHGLVIGHPGASTNDYQIRNCWFQCIAQSAIVLSAQGVQTDLTCIENCVIELCRTGIDVRDKTTTTTIINNKIWGPSSAIQAVGGSGLEIRGNRCVYGNIDVNDYRTLVIQNNYIGSLTSGAKVRHAIKLTDVEYSNISDNQIYQTPFCGIYSKDGTRNLIADNSIRNNQIKFNPWAGIWLAGTETETLVIGNQSDHEITQYGSKYGLYTEDTTTLIGIGQNFLSGWEAPMMILGTVRALDTGPMTITDGDLTVYDKTDLGAEQVTDGDFATDPASSGWTLGSGWTWDDVNDNVYHTSGTAALAFAYTATADRYYQVQFTISDSGVSLTPVLLARIGNNYRQWVYADGTYTQIIRAKNTSGLTFTPVTGFVGAIDDVSLKEIQGGDVYAAGFGRFGGVIEDVNKVTADLTNFQTSGVHIIDSSGGAITGALADGTIVGQKVRFVCKTAGNNIDISVSHHVTSDPEVIRLNAALEWVELIWDGTDWVEVSGNGQTYP